MENYLIKDCLIHIFTFLTEGDLSNASCVCKDWNDAAETPWLWRRMALQRWVFCNLGLGGDGAQSWKRYFLRRSHLEKKMSEGKRGGYTCKSLRGHTGRVIGLGHLNGSSSDSPDLWSSSATVCSASTDGTVRGWGVQKGELLWSSPASQNPITDMITDQQHNLVVTADSTGLVSTWHGQTGQQMATFATGFSHSKLLQFTANDDWFLTVGGRLGSVVTLAGPDLTKRSTFTVCDSFQVTTLLISPDRKWITAGTRDNDDISPKVIYTESLTSESEDEERLSQSLPVAGCRAAVFIPTQPSRLAVAHDKLLTVFDVCLKKSKYKAEIIVNQVKSFSLNQISSTQLLLKAKDSNCIVLAAGRQLFVYSLSGELLQSFSDHTLPISAVWVDSFRVVTASLDLSMRVLTWKNNQDGGQTLEGRYHLLGGSHSMSRGFTHVVCDYSSIVASVEGQDGSDVLKAYSFTS
ncbi:F-box/WD repeat-containing protein 12 [Periophthalmus magnuspinnatus]|uniref:F-box/WD repeat-containing protein 12 n=1 Tax=Periophthalmus magnuspinnatus TaxID=409849 RepID=UPI00145BE2AF|nr:F-box/WD repeat-containing protein 12 [Periophthalmus magnuspinnatus]